MLRIDETLFVEHKAGVGDENSYGLVRAVAAFANTVGGWVLLGIQGGRPVEQDQDWAADDAPPFVDFIRDRLRGELDPLPAFEAAIRETEGHPVGVVRVYESTDTPHVAVRSGSVFVREVAGVTDAADPGKPGGGKRGERRYEAAKIRSRAQLIELGERGQRAAKRAMSLLDRTVPLPLVEEQMPFDLTQPRRGDVALASPRKGAVIVRLAPLTLPPRFRSWATTAECSAAVLTTGEELARRRGFNSEWLVPDPSGAAVQLPMEPGTLHSDGAGLGLEATAHVVLDGAGVAGTAYGFAGPENEERRAWARLDTIAGFIAPLIAAGAELLCSSEFLGRARCQIDLISLQGAFMLRESGNKSPREWVPSSAEITLPADPAEIDAVARRAANAYARSAGVPAWDPPSQS